MLTTGAGTGDTESFEMSGKWLIFISLILVFLGNCFKNKLIPGSENWSEHQGYMNWRNAKTKCESIGMRLPTRKE